MVAVDFLIILKLGMKEHKLVCTILYTDLVIF